jgi:transposase, IS30 family
MRAGRRQEAGLAGINDGLNVSVLILALHKVSDSRAGRPIFAIFDVSSEARRKEHSPHGPPCLDGVLDPDRAQARRYRPRRNSQFGRGHWERVEGLLREELSPEQVSGHLRLKRKLSISHETIYRHIWQDLRSGGTLHEHLRGARKSCRKRSGRYDSRGRLAGKRMIWERSASVERRGQIGHWEIDTMMGESPRENNHCVLPLVERKSSYLMLGKLQARTAAETNRALLGLLALHPGRMRTITADNGTEFHWYGQAEALSPVKFYFATPHHSWERRTNENTNGLIRQYLPKGATMARLTQSQCDLIAEHLNNRPRKRCYKTPNQCFLQT